MDSSVYLSCHRFYETDQLPKLLVYYYLNYEGNVSTLLELYEIIKIGQFNYYS